METTDKQAILAIMSRTRRDVATASRRVQMYQQVGETPPETLRDQLQTDMDYLEYLKSLVTA